VTADNASSNAVQVAALYGLENSFDEANRVRCFNHTIQLAGKALIKPFNAGMGKVEDSDNCTSDVPCVEEFNEDDDIDDDGDNSLPDDRDVEDDNDEILSEEEHSSLMADTLDVRETVSKVRLSFFCSIFVADFLQLRQLSFAIIHSTTIALPAWRQFCRAHSLEVKNIPRDVVTRWNSTHDMMAFAIEYRKPIDSITADKSLKLRRYELDNEGWNIIEQLVCVLQVCILDLSSIIC
jgi:hypothetical protein